MSRKPKQANDRWFDFSWEHFAEAGDLPNITVHHGENCYEPQKLDLMKQVKELERDAKWLKQAAQYLKKKYKPYKRRSNQDDVQGEK